MPTETSETETDKPTPPPVPARRWSKPKPPAPLTLADAAVHLRGALAAGLQSLIEAGVHETDKFRLLTENHFETVKNQVADRAVAQPDYEAGVAHLRAVVNTLNNTS